MRHVQPRFANLLCAEFTSRSTIFASAAAGMPRRPRRKLVGPSCIEHVLSGAYLRHAARRSGSARRPSRRAARMTSSSRIGLPSSVTAAAPARCSAAKSVSDAPRELRVAAAMGKTFTTAPRSGWRNHATHSSVSTTGEVLGMVQTEVKPPAAAAAGAAGDRLFVALSRLAQMNMQIDESRRNDQSAGIEFLVGAGADLVGQGDLSYTSITQKNVHGCIDLRRGVDHVAALDQQAWRFRFRLFTPVLLRSCIFVRSECTFDSGNPRLISLFPVPAPKLPCAWALHCEPHPR